MGIASLNVEIYKSHTNTEWDSSERVNRLSQRLLNCTIQKEHKTRTFMPSKGFKFTVPAIEPPHT